MHVRLDVLAAIEKKSKPTHILYKVGSNWQHMEKQLEILTQLGLIEERQYTKTASANSVPHALSDNPKKVVAYRYFLTDKGRKALNLWKELSIILHMGDMENSEL